MNLCMMHGNHRLITKETPVHPLELRDGILSKDQASIHVLIS